MNTEDSLPTKSDFDAWSGSLDSLCAWEHFGGLTIAEAHAKFRENPYLYQEDFVWMGSRAFAYYFPVIEDYIKSVASPEFEENACIIAKDIRSQFDGVGLKHLRRLVPRVRQLTTHVLNKIQSFGSDDEDREWIATAWSELADHMDEIRDS